MSGAHHSAPDGRSSSGPRDEETTVLVADDDDALRESIADVIRDAGFRVLEARNGEEALRLAVREAPHAIVLDHRMPGMTGADVVAELRRVNLHIPIVYVTAAREVLELTQALGIPDYLGKPFGLDDLMDMIHRALGRRATV